MFDQTITVALTAIKTILNDILKTLKEISEKLENKNGDSQE